jgi:MltA-interacting protein MipA
LKDGLSVYKQLINRVTGTALLLTSVCAWAGEPVANPNDSLESLGEQKTQWSYVVGARMRYVQLPDNTNAVKLAPVFGLRYGRFKIGSESDAGDWYSGNNVRRDPTVSYDAVRNKDWRVSLALRIQNVTADEAFDVTQAGRKTLRGRFLLNYNLADNMALGGEITRDLLNRGDGSTFSLGASRSFMLNEKSALQFSAGVTWADKTHWQTVTSAFAGSNNVGAGLGSAQFGVGYRYAISNHWAWFAGAGLSRPQGDIARLEQAKQRHSAQLGFLYFSGPQVK